MKKIIGFALLGLMATSGSWAFGYKECVKHSIKFCREHRNTLRSCRIKPEDWCNEIDNIKKAKKDYKKVQAVKSNLPKPGHNVLGR